MLYPPWPVNAICLSRGFFLVSIEQKSSRLDDDDFRTFPKRNQNFPILTLERVNKSKTNYFCNNIPEHLFRFESEDSIYCIKKHIKSYGSMLPEQELDFCLQLLLSVLYHEDILQQYIDEENGEEEKANQKFLELHENGILSDETKNFLLEIMRKDADQQDTYLLDIQNPWENNIFGAFQVLSSGVFNGHCQIKFLPTGEIICQDAGFEVFGKMIVEEYCRTFPLKKIQQCVSFYDLFIF